MSPINHLCQELKARFPSAEIETRNSDCPDGFQFLNLWIDSLEVAVEWKPEHGFGIAAYNDDAASIEGLFESPRDWYKSVPCALQRITDLITAAAGCH